MQLVTDPTLRASVAERLVDDVCLVLAEVATDDRGVYLTNAKPGRTQPSALTRVLRACGCDGEDATGDINDWDLPCLLRITQYVLFQVDFDAKYRRLTEEEIEIRDAARRIYDAIDGTMACLHSQQLEAKS